MTATRHSETYKGRKIAARTRKSRDAGTEVVATVNGTHVAAAGRDIGSAVTGIRNWIDFIDREPVNGARWAPYWYAPGTYELCPEGLHPQAVGGHCLHPTCLTAENGA